jgi:hypothetical protein
MINITIKNGNNMRSILEGSNKEVYIFDYGC